MIVFLELGLMIPLPLLCTLSCTLFPALNVISSGGKGVASAILIRRFLIFKGKSRG